MGESVTLHSKAAGEAFQKALFPPAPGTGFLEVQILGPLQTAILPSTYMFKSEYLTLVSLLSLTHIGALQELDLTPDF